MQTAAIFVADGKPVQEILDGDQTDTLEIRGAAGADAFEELQRRRQETLGGHRKSQIKDLRLDWKSGLRLANLQ